MGITMTEKDHFHTPEILLRIARAITMSTTTVHRFILAAAVAAMASGVYDSETTQKQTSTRPTVKITKRSRTASTPK